MSIENRDYLKGVMDKIRGQHLAQPAFAFGMHKGGSTMLSNFIQIYTERADIKGISLSDLLFRKGVSDEEYTNDSAITGLLEEKYVYYGFRYVPAFMLSNKAKFVNRNAIVLVRDPRDCVVSAYYSFLKSHVVLADKGSAVAQQVEKERKIHTSSSVDEYALTEVHRFVEELESYAYFSHENTRIFRYEDIIFDKRNFFTQAINHLGLPWKQEAFELALNKVDVFPDKERPDQHVRNVKPGNYREKLKQSTITTINNKFKMVLDLYGYGFK